MIGDKRVGVNDLVEKANSEIRTFSQEEARALLGRDDVVFVDIRDIRELTREGMLEGAFHAPRGMLEFWIDPDSPYHKPIFDEDKTFVFYCGSGWRSALATKTAQEVGLLKCGHLDGGFSAWSKAGHPTVEKS
ncbi:MAG: rhodanese-like domain-containing protein [Rhizobiales bacterium]|nr:rhodanese-like domain-containing protein [Hyphomicrobiales bacterium]